MKKILHLCADIGSDSKPYRDAGYEVILVGRDIGIENFTPPKDVYGIIANPPCTHFSVARTCAKTPRDLKEGMRLVKECLRVIWECQYNVPADTRTVPLKFWCLENPSTGMLKYFLGKPAFTYCPSEYGADFTKRTALWGNFNAPQKPFFLMNPIRNNSLASGKGRDAITAIMKYKGSFEEKRRQQMNERSMAWPKFAEAFYEANK